MTFEVTEIELMPAIRVERKKEVSNVLLYRGWLDSGEHSEGYCVELQFKDRRAAISYLRRHRLPYQEVEDHEELPWMPT